MKGRNISPEDVEAVIAEPEKVEPTERGRLNAFKRMGNRHIKVTYKDLADEILVISAMDKSD
jgi:hypothetical protein